MIAVVVVMVALVLILKIVCENEIYISYSYARSGSIKPRSLNRISFTKIRIQSTPKNKESTYNLVNHWLEHGEHTSDRTNEQTNKHTSNGLSLLCTMYITFIQTYTIQIHLYRVAECIHLSVWRVCGVLCMRLWFYVYHHFIGLGICSLSSHRRNKNKLDRLCMCCVCTLANDVDCVPKINNKLFLCWCHSFSYARHGSYVCFYINLIQKCRNVNLTRCFPFIRRTFAMRIYEDSARTPKYTIVANKDLDIDLEWIYTCQCTCIALFYHYQ